MYSAYLSIVYRCNQKCSCCPYTEGDIKYPDMTLEEIFEIADNIKKKAGNSIPSMIISGGEPTLHRQLPDIIEGIQQRNIAVHILSNGERFGSETYLKTFENKNIDWEKIRITTTFHSHKESVHEEVNGAKGSFSRSLKGLHNLAALGAKVTVKHCITGMNYKELVDFYEFVDHSFSRDIDIYLCGIDYVGIPEDVLDNEKLSFLQLKPYLETFLDHHIQVNSERYIHCSHIPLCAADPYYWKYLQINSEHLVYDGKGRNGVFVESSNSDFGIHETFCKDCIVKQYCMGTYRSAYPVIGSTGIKPYIR